MYPIIMHLEEVERQNSQLYAELAKTATEYVASVAKENAFPDIAQLPADIPDITPFKNLVKKAGFEIDGLEKLTEDTHSKLRALAFTIADRVVMNRKR